MNDIKIILEIGEVNNLIGRVLTIVDASYSDEKQREGVKSLMKKEIWSWAKEPHIGISESELVNIQAEELPDDLKDFDGGEFVKNTYPHIPQD